jgi:predicted amidohydrolase
MVQVEIACLQLASLPFDNAANLRQASKMIADAASGGANICLLPELFNPGYSLMDKNFMHAEPMDGSTIRALCDLSAQLNVYIAGGLAERAQSDFYNTMFFIGPRGVMATYRKRHVASLENKYWKRGERATIVDTEFGAIGLGICADMQYPDLWAEYAGNVDLVLICSAWGTPENHSKTAYAVAEERQCKELPVHVSRTIGVPVAYCNAVQNCEGDLPIVGKMYCLGFSKIVANGIIVAALDSRQEAIIQATVDITGARIVTNSAVFKRWIRFSCFEKLARFFVETVGAWYGRRYYASHKKRHL